MAEFTPDVAQQEVPKRIERRIPIINEDSAQAFPLKQIDRQWSLLSEAIRRDIIAKPDVRKKMLPFCATPVSETLPDSLVNSLYPIDPRVEKLATRYRASISTYLSLPAVPSDLINPDMRHTLDLTEADPQVAIERDMKRYGIDYLQALRRLGIGRYTKGISHQERMMVVRRYKYARDTKILALGAEILEQGSLNPDQNGEIILPSGIKIAIDKNQMEQGMDLLKPHLWQKRRQIKDRVYEIQVGNRKYILKEKKTTTHLDTKKGGHKEGRSSMEEYTIAQDLQQNGTAEKDRLKLRWEKPIGYVTYPDGYQFAIFGFEEGLSNSYNATVQLNRGILNHREQFEEEFQDIATLAQKFKKHEWILSFEDRSDMTRLDSLELTFEEFAIAKALRMTRQAQDILEETLITNNYENSDFDGYAFRVNDGNNVGLEIIGFDFEYFSKVRTDEILERLRQHKEYRESMEAMEVLGILNGLKKESSNTDVTIMEKAAYYALLAKEGLLQDIDENPETSQEIST